MEHFNQGCSKVGRLNPQSRTQSNVCAGAREALVPRPRTLGTRLLNPRLSKCSKQFFQQFVFEHGNIFLGLLSSSKEVSFSNV
jgi:hypothetical protein